jgi:hypothetical protein
MSPNEKLSAGVAKEDITPEVGTKLFLGTSTGAIDLPLYTKALVLSDGNRTIAICTNDLLDLPRDIVIEARRQIQEKSGIPEENILLCASHTHKGPYPIEGSYRDKLLSKIVNVVCKASDNREKACIGYAKGAIVGVNINRRNPYGPVDPDVGVIRVDKVNGEHFAILFNFAMHGVVLGHSKYNGVSPDWIGHATKYIEELWGEGTIALFTQGAAGNVNPYTSYGYTGFTNKGGSVKDAENIGKLLALETIIVADQIQTTPEVKISMASSRRRLWEEKNFEPIERWRRLINKKKQELESLKRQDVPFQQVEVVRKRIEYMEKFGDLFFEKLGERFKQKRENPEESEIMVIGINDLRLVCVGGELFTEYSLEIKEKALSMGYKSVFVVELANGAWDGYIPTEIAYSEEYGYESFYAEILSGLSPKAGQLIVDTALELISKCGKPIETPPKPFIKQYLPNGEAYAIKPLKGSRLDRLMETLPYHHELRARRTEVIHDLP